MKDIAIIRCEKNETRCPLTSCMKSVEAADQGFAVHGEPIRLRGVFTCRCESTDPVKLAAVLKAKGADTVHLPTCTFASKGENGWAMGCGLCPKIEEIADAIRSTGIPCVLGTAHLPQGYSPPAEQITTVRT